ncbi:hypothetical protein BDB01DRAFT_11169 [Pilobolus umbonatus]|nr:hypothetical protein BDB01DRAFT_11169 [Pilobolus umbonatus]
MSSESDIGTNTLKKQVETLDLLKQKTQELINCKSALLMKKETFDQKKNILEEVTASKLCLQKEKKTLLEMIQNVQRDLDTTVELERSLNKECDELGRSLSKLRDQQYNQLLDDVNRIRTQQGLPKLPNIQQELEAKMAKDLDKRRKEWQYQES